MGRGYTLAECGSDPTVQPGAGRFTIQVRAASNSDGTSLEGPALEEFVIDTPSILAQESTYAVAERARQSAQLTVRPRYGDEPQVVPSTEWAFVDARTVAPLPPGRFFRPGRLYELIYRAKEVRS